MYRQRGLFEGYIGIFCIRNKFFVDYEGNTMGALAKSPMPRRVDRGFQGEYFDIGHLGLGTPPIGVKAGCKLRFLPGR